MTAAAAVTLLAQIEPDAGTRHLGLAWAVVFLVAITAFVWWAFTAGYDFRIKIRGRDVDIAGKRITVALRNELLHFFANDFPPKPRLTIYGSRRRDRTYRLRFVGGVTDGEKQQVRNFLMARV